MEPPGRFHVRSLPRRAPAFIGLTALAGLAAIEGVRMGAGTHDSLIAGVVLFAALVSSIVGFAFSVLAGSALAFLSIDPVEAVTTMGLCSLAIQSYSVWQLRASIRWRGVAPMLAAGALTTPLGVALLLHIDRRAHAALLGLIVIGYAGAMLLQRRLPVVRGTPSRDALAGALGGLVGGLSAAPGLFVTIWCSLRGGDKVQQRATYQPFILASQIVLLAVLAVAAPAQGDTVRTLGFVPFALLGAVAGFALFRRLTTPQFHAAMSLLLIASGAGLLAHAR